MSGYKHVYFPIRGRGERTRLAFVATKVEFEDVRVPFEDWQKEKASGRPPFDELPYIVTPEGKILGQSGAICKYICKKGGLCPSDPFDEALADSLSDCALDLRERLIKIYYEEDAARKEKMQKEFFETTLPARLKKYEGFLESRDGGKAYLFGEKLNYADISIFDFLNNILLGGKTDVPKELDKFPLLAGHYTRVLNVPEIKAWIEKRPQTTG